MTSTNKKQFHYTNRREYLDVQIARSQKKFGYCKVFFEDVLRYQMFIENDMKKRGQNVLNISPILCLGVRSGAEVDVFRAVFLSPLMKSRVVQKWIVGRDKTKYAADKIKLAKYVSLGAGWREDGRVWGVELNPSVSRPDVHVSSFDELPPDWKKKFKVIYSNSFDHSQDPEKTIAEWKRVSTDGAYLIIAFPVGNKPSQTDPLGQLSYDFVRDIVKSDVVFTNEVLNRTRYHEICFRLPG